MGDRGFSTQVNVCSGQIKAVGDGAAESAHSVAAMVEAAWSTAPEALGALHGWQTAAALGSARSVSTELARRLADDANGCLDTVYDGLRSVVGADLDTADAYAAVSRSVA